MGSGGMMPMPYRLLTSLVVRFKGRLYLFDAGEGTQIGIKGTGVGIKALRVIAISHLHGDHCLGLAGVLMMRSQVPQPPPLTLLGPPGIRRLVESVRHITEFHLNFPIDFLEWQEHAPELAYEDENVRILWAPLKHTTLCLGYRLEERDRPGKFNPNAARRLGVPQGPLWGELQRGMSVELPDGRRVKPQQVLGPPRRGRRVCYVVDTRPCKNLYRLCREVDLAFIDGMFHPEHKEEAESKGHMTVEEASSVARRAGVREAVLVHISPRYEEADLERLSKAALSHFPNVRMGMDFQFYHVAMPEKASPEARKE